MGCCEMNGTWQRCQPELGVSEGWGAWGNRSACEEKVPPCQIVCPGPSSTPGKWQKLLRLVRCWCWVCSVTGPVDQREVSQARIILGGQAWPWDEGETSLALFPHCKDVFLLAGEDAQVVAWATLRKREHVLGGNLCFYKPRFVMRDGWELLCLDKLLAYKGASRQSRWSATCVHSSGALSPRVQLCWHGPEPCGDRSFVSEAAAASSDCYMCHQSLTHCRHRKWGRGCATETDPPGSAQGFMCPSPVSQEVSVTSSKHAEEVIKPDDSNWLWNYNCGGWSTLTELSKLM